MPQLELFHAIADPRSARLRRLVVTLGLERRLRFRNVVYPEVVADLEARGGREAPALWDGEALLTVEEAIEARLRGAAEGA